MSIYNNYLFMPIQQVCYNVIIVGGIMDNENLKISELFTMPFKETDETQYIKKYAQSLSKLDDFKDLKIFYVQFYNSSTLKKKLKLSDIYSQIKGKILSVVFGLLPYNGNYDIFRKEIMILTDNQIRHGQINHITIDLSTLKVQIAKNPNSLKRTCCNILKTIYHEKKHHLQMTEAPSNSFESIMYQIEMNLKFSLYGAVRYFIQHDKWYFEIDANNYGVENAIKHYQNNPQDKNFDMNYLERLRKIYYYDKMTYNFDSFFTTYNMYREKLPVISDTRNFLSNILLKDKKAHWHQVLYGADKRLKNVEEILSNPLLNQLDPKFINYVLTSRYLNEQTDYNSLSLNALKRLKTEFEKRYKNASTIIENLLKETDKRIINRYKNELARLRMDIEFYKDTILRLQSKIYNKNINQSLEEITSHLL